MRSRSFHAIQWKHFSMLPMNNMTSNGLISCVLNSQHYFCSNRSKLSPTHRTMKDCVLYVDDIFRQVYSKTQISRSLFNVYSNLTDVFLLGQFWHSQFSQSQFFSSGTSASVHSCLVLYWAAESSSLSCNSGAPF